MQPVSGPAKHDFLTIEESPALHGTVELEGAKNAVLVIMASLLLTSGKSTLRRVPPSRDVFQMIATLESLGASIEFCEATRTLIVDTSNLHGSDVPSDAMRAMRASTLVMGPLLARYGSVKIALPGGCVLGTRGIDFHIRAFQAMGATVDIVGSWIHAHADVLHPRSFMLEYPSVGATENIMMAAAIIPGITTIKNAAIEPEVLDFIDVLRKMGVSIDFEVPGTIIIEGTTAPRPVDHEIIPDRLEAGTFLVAAAATGGTLTLPDAQPHMMELFLNKLSDMGHTVSCTTPTRGISFTAAHNARTVSFKTMPYPGFPTDLQELMMVAQLCATGTSVIYETVFELRVVPHVTELKKMGAPIDIIHEMAAHVHGRAQLHGASLTAPNIRGAAALTIAGLVAQGTTTLHGVHHLRRGYVHFEEKLQRLGARIEYHTHAAPESCPTAPEQVIKSAH